MIQRTAIRDTSAQDHVVSTRSPQQRSRRQWLLFGGIGVATLLAAAWLLSGWSAGSSSFDASRLRIAEVKRGDLVRDIAADGRVIAANSPTLYAIAAGTVILKVVAGDVVKKGQPLAEIDSPELRSKLAQEESTLASLEAEASRAVLDATARALAGAARWSTRPRSSAPLRNATSSATSAASMAARCRRSTWPRPRTN